MIKRPELFGDPSIRFLLNAYLLFHDSKDLIINYINKFDDVNNTIVIDDLDDKIQPFKSETASETNGYGIQIQSKNNFSFALYNFKDLTSNEITNNDGILNSIKDQQNNKPIIENEVKKQIYMNMNHK